MSIEHQPGKIGKNFHFPPYFNMEDYYTVDNVIACLMIIFGLTSLLIFRNVRKSDFETVDSVADKKYWWFCSNINLMKYLAVYKMYFKHNGFNLILTLNIISYVLACIMVLIIVFFERTM